jgi:galactonate dehydratase
MAEAYDAAIAPHCPLGPIALAACIQVDACAPNFLAQEPGASDPDQSEADGLDYLTNPEVFAYDDGYIHLPEGPGLGIEVDESVVRDRMGDTDVIDVDRHEDGSVKEM